MPRLRRSTRLVSTSLAVAGAVFPIHRAAHAAVAGRFIASAVDEEMTTGTWGHVGADGDGRYLAHLKHTH